MRRLYSLFCALLALFGIGTSVAKIADDQLHHDMDREMADRPCDRCGNTTGGGKV